MVITSHGLKQVPISPLNAKKIGDNFLLYVFKFAFERPSKSNVDYIAKLF